MWRPFFEFSGRENGRVHTHFGHSRYHAVDQPEEIGFVHAADGHQAEKTVRKNPSMGPEFSLRIPAKKRIYQKIGGVTQQISRIQSDVNPQALPRKTQRRDVVLSGEAKQYFHNFALRAAAGIREINTFLSGICRATVMYIRPMSSMNGQMFSISKMQAVNPSAR